MDLLLVWYYCGCGTGDDKRVVEEERAGDDERVVEEEHGHTYLFEEMPSSQVMAARRSDE